MKFHFYETSGGEDLIHQELLLIKDERLQKQIVNKLSFYAQKTFQQFLAGKDLEKIKRTSLWELKFRTSPPFRTLCFLISLSDMLILHLLKKDYDGPIRNQEIQIALSRLKDYNLRH